MGNVRFQTFDLGGHEEAREVWNDYYVDASAIVFLVDSHDRARFPEAKQELSQLLLSEDLKDVPFVVLGNKIDLQGATSEQELRQVLGLEHTTGKNTRSSDSRPIEVFMCSIVRRAGYGEAFRWLSNFI